MNISVLFPAFLFGGAEAVCAWLCQALVHRYNVTLITFSHLNLNQIDAQYGTNLSNSGIKLHIVRIPLPHYLRIHLETSHSAYALRQAILMRYYHHKLRTFFNLAISAFNEMDFGERGIQYVHFPMFGVGAEKIRKLVGYPDSPYRKLYRWILRIWAGYNHTRMLSNLTLTNSKWTARAIKIVYGIEPKVLYPPITWHKKGLPWENRENAVVVVSRIVREKHIERAIEIMKIIRSQGFEMPLYLVGGIGDPKYEKELKAHYAHESWIYWQPRLTRIEYENLLGKCKFGLHTRENEQFGIGVAEMVSAGMIPLVPAEGGTTEIVDEIDELCWRTPDEAAKKLIRIIRDFDLQIRLRKKMSLKKNAWDAERFQCEVQQLIENYIEEISL